MRILLKKEVHHPHFYIPGRYQWAREALPLPWVRYPNLYGCFLGFASRKSGELFLCSCAKKAFNVWMKRESGHLDINYFPDILISDALRLNSVENAVRFRNRICHRCQKVTPSKEWCAPMYGGLFKRKFGWYIKQQELTLDRLSVPDALRRLRGAYAEAESQLASTQALKTAGGPEWLAALSKSRRVALNAQRALDNYYENAVREDIEIPLIGEGWVGEMNLLREVRGIFRGKHVLHHHRPEWLKPQELDIFIPHLGIGIEYQGQQHYEPIEAWGGELGLIKRQQLDERKRKLCAQNNIRLVEIPFDSQMDCRSLAALLKTNQRANNW